MKLPLAASTIRSEQETRSSRSAEASAKNRCARATASPSFTHANGVASPSPSIRESEVQVTAMGSFGLSRVGSATRAATAGRSVTW